MNSFYLESLGCAKNLVDSERFACILQRAGLEAAEYPEEADLVLVNTCSFLVDSLRELDLVLSDLAQLKREERIEQLVVTGCVMNRGQKEFRELYPEVDAWIGLKDFAALEAWLGLAQQANHERVGIQGGYYRYLRISDGCANNCSYCTIPSIRGPLRSVDMDVLVREAEALARDEDFPPCELVVIAQDTANYGLDIYGRKALPELLERLHAIPQYKWVRVLYMHPDHFDLEWLELWKKLPNLLPYFEIPIQHSEDHLLTAMNRQKGRLELEKMFNAILREIPEAVLRTTLISGFPGETKEDALALQDFVKRILFLHLGVFNYSAEEGTPAAEMIGQVSAKTSTRRRDRLLEQQEERTARRLESYVGKTVDVLIEDLADDEEDEGYQGRAWFQAPEIDGLTYVQGQDLEAGKIYRVQIDDVIGVDLFGRVVAE